VVARRDLQTPVRQDDKQASPMAPARPPARRSGQNGGMSGRPTLLTDEREADLTLLLAYRVPIEVAARSVGVSTRSVRRWLAERDLRERVAELRAAEPEQVALTTEARLVVLLLRGAKRLAGERVVAGAPLSGTSTEHEGKLLGMDAGMDRLLGVGSIQENPARGQAPARSPSL
jgi:hypothetical protein